MAVLATKKTQLRQNCCPEVVVGDENVLIKDDFGGTVKMTREQFCMLATGIKSGKIVS